MDLAKTYNYSSDTKEPLPDSKIPPLSFNSSLYVYGTPFMMPGPYPGTFEDLALILYPAKPYSLIRQPTGIIVNVYTGSVKLVDLDTMFASLADQFPTVTIQVGHGHGDNFPYLCPLISSDYSNEYQFDSDSSENYTDFVTDFDHLKGGNLLVINYFNGDLGNFVRGLIEFDFYKNVTNETTISVSGYRGVEWIGDPYYSSTESFSSEDIIPESDTSWFSYAQLVKDINKSTETTESEGPDPTYGAWSTTTTTTNSIGTETNKAYIYKYPTFEWTAKFKTYQVVNLGDLETSSEDEVIQWKSSLSEDILTEFSPPGSLRIAGDYSVIPSIIESYLESLGVPKKSSW